MMLSQSTILCGLGLTNTIRSHALADCFHSPCRLTRNRAICRRLLAVRVKLGGVAVARTSSTVNQNGSSIARAAKLQWQSCSPPVWALKSWPQSWEKRFVSLLLRASLASLSGGRHAVIAVGTWPAFPLSFIVARLVLVVMMMLVERRERTSSCPLLPPPQRDAPQSLWKLLKPVSKRLQKIHEAIERPRFCRSSQAYSPP